MGNYNPHAPYILGQESVPIRDVSLSLSPAVNALEVGHGFTLTTARQVGYGRFYVAQRPNSQAYGQVIQISVYKRGEEALSGPVRSLIIPCSSASISGNADTSSGSATVSPTVALADPADGESVLFSGGTPSTAAMDMFFNTSANTYAQALVGKRILAVNLLYTSTSHNLANMQITCVLGPPTDANKINYAASRRGGINSPETGSTSFLQPIPDLSRVHFGEVTPFFTSDPFGTAERVPWTYDNLLKFEASAGTNRIRARFDSVSTDGTAFIQFFYAALEVVYCEETRQAVGGQAFGINGLGVVGYTREYALGANSVPMRTVPGLVQSPVLPAGDYTVVVSSPQTGIDRVVASPYPDLNALEQLIAMPAHPGYEVEIPSPPDDHIGDVFAREATLILPQLSLHASGAAFPQAAPLTEPHVYGRQAAAQVWGSNTATQNVYKAPGIGSNTFPWVRFYARRFGSTTVSLTLDSPDIGGASVVVTPSEWDALPDIIDGWKEVTKRFDTPPAIGLAAGQPRWRWTANGELAGNRWEILANSAPAISGIPGVGFQLAPSASQLSTATYDPADPSNILLNWMPQGIASQYVSGASNDSATDAVIIFSQDPPTITGFAISTTTQTVTGLGYDCGGLPCCIPSGIGYNRLTWTAQSILPTTGFGAYEVQRFDTRVGDWQTIMMATGTGTAAFNDFEARVGVSSVYRIRVWNALNFYGAWSAQVTGSVPAPGVTGGACSAALTPLIFTTNSAQSGSLNAAYAVTWARDPVEDFTLPEADQVTFQPMYNRDGGVAFHGSERGLEAFSRLVLINNAVVSPLVLADTRTLRDLAWADVPYVCVRDHRGNRWFANVRVPGVIFTDDAALQTASVGVIELQTGPYAVVNP